MNQRYCILDYETRSEIDLKKVGGYEYSVHPTTSILCVAWRIGTREELKTAQTQVWSPIFRGGCGELVDALCYPEIMLVAHNALFEQLITRNVLKRIRPELKTIPISRWICTASLAAAMSLPRKLEQACLALKLPVQKDMEGHKLVLKYCKPRRPSKKDPSKFHHKISDLKRIMQYCKTDIDAETEIFLRLPPLSPTERKIWELDQKINWQGFRVDRPLVKKVLAMIEKETVELNHETQEKTGLLSANQRNELLSWLMREGLVLPDLRAKTVSDAIAGGGLEGNTHRMLQIRQAISKTSTAKYLAFERRTRSDGRCRDILLYHAAHTGRWGGLGLNPQNFPQGVIKDLESACQDLSRESLDLIRLLYGDPMSAFSSCLRGMIIPSQGNELVCADFATIEVRVLFWLAGHARGLQMFFEGQDIYRHMAGDIFSKKMAEIENPSSERNLGKSAILGCGFGMGWIKFLTTCQNKGQEISEELAQKAVQKYRETHAPIPALWKRLEAAAILAVKYHQKKIPKKVVTNRTTWWVNGKFLFCELPSGRKLAYYGPEIRYEKTSWGEPRPVLYTWGTNSLTRKWECSGTWGGTLTENVVQATARDIMAEAMLRVDQSGYDIVLSVHDELLAEQEKGSWPLSRFEKTMSEVPKWAEGCPIDAKGWIGMRYRK